MGRCSLRGIMMEIPFKKPIWPWPKFAMCSIYPGWFRARFNRPEKSENKLFWSDDINYVWVSIEYSSIMSLWNTREYFFWDAAILLLLGSETSWLLIGSLCANLKKAPPLGDAALWVHDLASRAWAGSQLLFVPLGREPLCHVQTAFP